MKGQSKGQYDQQTIDLIRNLATHPEEPPTALALAQHFTLHDPSTGEEQHYYVESSFGVPIYSRPLKGKTEQEFTDAFVKMSASRSYAPSNNTPFKAKLSLRDSSFLQGLFPFSPSEFPVPVQTQHKLATWADTTYGYVIGALEETSDGQQNALSLYTVAYDPEVNAESIQNLLEQYPNIRFTDQQLAQFKKDLAAKIVEWARQEDESFSITHPNPSEVQSPCYITGYCSTLSPYNKYVVVMDPNGDSNTNPNIPGKCLQSWRFGSMEEFHQAIAKARETYPQLDLKFAHYPPKAKALVTLLNNEVIQHYEKMLPTVFEKDEEIRLRMQKAEEQQLAHKEKESAFTHAWLDLRATLRDQTLDNIQKVTKVSGFITYCRETIKVTPNLGKLDLSNLDFSKTDIDFSGCILNNCKLNNTNVSGKKFNNASLLGVTAQNANFRESDLRNAQMSSQAERSNYKNTDFNYAIITDKEHTSTSFKGATLTFTTFIGAEINKDAYSSCFGGSDFDFYSATPPKDRASDIEKTRKRFIKLNEYATEAVQKRQAAQTSMNEAIEQVLLNPMPTQEELDAFSKAKPGARESSFLSGVTARSKKKSAPNNRSAKTNNPAKEEAAQKRHEEWLARQAAKKEQAEKEAAEQKAREEKIAQEKAAKEAEASRKQAEKEAEEKRAAEQRRQQEETRKAQETTKQAEKAPAPVKISYAAASSKKPSQTKKAQPKQVPATKTPAVNEQTVTAVKTSSQAAAVTAKGAWKKRLPEVATPPQSQGQNLGTTAPTPAEKTEGQKQTVTATSNHKSSKQKDTPTHRGFTKNDAAITQPLVTQTTSAQPTEATKKANTAPLPFPELAGENPVSTPIPEKQSVSPAVEQTKTSEAVTLPTSPSSVTTPPVNDALPITPTESVHTVDLPPANNNGSHAPVTEAPHTSHSASPTLTVVTPEKITSPAPQESVVTTSVTAIQPLTQVADVPVQEPTTLPPAINKAPVDDPAIIQSSVQIYPPIARPVPMTVLVDPATGAIVSAPFMPPHMVIPAMAMQMYPQQRVSFIPPVENLTHTGHADRFGRPLLRDRASGMVVPAPEVAQGQIGQDGIWRPFEGTQQGYVSPTQYSGHPAPSTPKPISSNSGSRDTSEESVMEEGKQEKGFAENSLKNSQTSLSPRGSYQEQQQNSNNPERRK